MTRLLAPALKSLALAALALAAAAPAARAQPDDAYGGHRPGAFYDVDRREADIQRRIGEAARSGELGRGQAGRAFAQLRVIRGEEAFRRDRHGGELRDWDRELLTRRLDQLAASLPR